jgi:cyclopropane-fatty-acyl-phospholipid synthase
MIKSLNKNLIRNLFTINNGLLILNLPDKSIIKIGKNNTNLVGILDIHSWNLFKRIFRSGAIGFSESYINNEVSSPNISNVIYLLSLNRHYNKDMINGNKFNSFLNYFKHIMKPNSKLGSRKNISYHYDLGNDFYSTWLDKSMTYSSALFNKSKFDLLSAQDNKYDNLCKISKIQKEDEILEIGCGWGGFAEYVAKKYHAKVTSITLSKRQAEYAKERVYKEGLNDLINIRICDYREIKQKYDKIISIEMFEAVGEKYWPVFFNKLNENIKDNGIIGLQLISIKEELYSSYKNNSDFIQKYIFPGGFLPSIKALQKEIFKCGLSMNIEKSFGKDYANTLFLWRKKFLSNWEEISKDKKFDKKFKRMWEYYLAYCEAGFLSGSTDVHQIILKKNVKI